MRPLLAPLALLSLATGAAAAPFQLERLVIEGESLPGLPGGVNGLSLRTPSINSSGEWAVSIGAFEPGSSVFVSGVLGNGGFRIQPGFDPDGSVAPFGSVYDGVSITDDGQLATVVRRTGSPSQTWLGDQLVTNSPGASFKDVTALPGDVLVSTVDTGISVFTLVSEPSGSGTWTTSIVHGNDVVTPVGEVLVAPTHRMGYAKSAQGRQAWSGMFITGGDDNPDEVTRGIIVDDAFLVYDGQPAALPGFEYRTEGGAGVQWNSQGDLFYGTALQSSGDGPAQAVGAIFNEHGTPLVSTLNQYDGLEEFGGWSVSAGNFDVDNSGNILWVAQSFEFPGPDHPFPFFRTALMYNDTLITKMGDVLDDGMIVVGTRPGRGLSDDGSWAIASLRVFDPDANIYRESVYRFAIPAPSTAVLFAGCGLAGLRRNREPLTQSPPAPGADPPSPPPPRGARACRCVLPPS